MANIPDYRLNAIGQRLKGMLKIIKDELIRFVKEHWYRENFLALFEEKWGAIIDLLDRTFREQGIRESEDLLNLGIKHIFKITQTPEFKTLNDNKVLKEIRVNWDTELTGIVNDLDKQVKQVINHGLTIKSSVTPVINRLKNIFAFVKAGKVEEMYTRHARMFTRVMILGITLGVLSYNKTKYEREKVSGIISGNNWRTVRDERRCKICKALDNQFQMLGDPFDVLVDGKHHTGLMPGLVHPRCRCWLSPEVIKL